MKKYLVPLAIFVVLGLLLAYATGAIWRFAMTTTVPGIPTAEAARMAEALVPTAP